VEIHKIKNILEPKKTITPFGKIAGKGMKEEKEKDMEGIFKEGNKTVPETAAEATAETTKPTVDKEQIGGKVPLTPKNEVDKQKVAVTTKEATISGRKYYLGGLDFVKTWEMLSDSRKFSNLSKRERQLVSILKASKATDIKGAVPIQSLAMALYQDDYSHNKLTYISKKVKSLENKGFVVKTKKGRDNYVYLNLSKIEGKKTEKGEEGVVEKIEEKNEGVEAESKTEEISREGAEKPVEEKLPEEKPVEEPVKETEPEKPEQPQEQVPKSSEVTGSEKPVEEESTEEPIEVPPIEVPVEKPVTPEELKKEPTEEPIKETEVEKSSEQIPEQKTEEKVEEQAQKPIENTEEKQSEQPQEQVVEQKPQEVKEESETQSDKNEEAKKSPKPK